MGRRANGRNTTVDFWLFIALSLSDNLIMCICDSLKYDGRSEAAKRAAVQSELRLAAATDMDIEELADLLGRDSSVAELKKRRAAIRRCSVPL